MLPRFFQKTIDISVITGYNKIEVSYVLTAVVLTVQKWELYKMGALPYKINGSYTRWESYHIK